MSEDRFVVNRLRTNPVSYTVQINHVAVGQRWFMIGEVHDVSLETETDRRRVAADLREMAQRLEDGKFEVNNGD